MWVHGQEKSPVGDLLHLWDLLAVILAGTRAHQGNARELLIKKKR